MNDLYNLEKNLKTLRLQYGYTQKQVAEKLGIATQSYQAYEWGVNVPTPAKLHQACTALRRFRSTTFSSDVPRRLTNRARRDNITVSQREDMLCIAVIAENRSTTAFPSAPSAARRWARPPSSPNRTRPRVYCKNCGREVSPDAALCPNCGAKIEPQNKKPINALGIAGFVLSLISLWGGSVFVVPIVGLILSAIGVAQREKYSSNGFATAGLVISIVTLVFWALMVARSSSRASSRAFSTPSSTPFTPRALPPFDKI